MGSIECTPTKRWRAEYRYRPGRSRSRTFDRKIDTTRYLEVVGTDIQRARTGTASASGR